MPTAMATAAMIFLLALVASARGESVSADRMALNAAYAEKLEALAKWCDGSGLQFAATEVRGWFISREPGKIYLFPPREGDPLKKRDAAQGKPDEWRTRFTALRVEQAKAIMGLAHRALADGQPSLALELVQEAVHEDPEQKEARILLGYVEVNKNEWRTPYELNQLTKGNVWTEQFGWLPKNQVDKYLAGERFSKGRWISAEADAQLHNDIKKGWRVDSEHYIVTTNDSPEAGAQLTQRLERLCGVWELVFVHYLETDAQLKRWFEGHRSPPRQQKPHGVTYFRDRAEYNIALKPIQPKIEMTLGLYLGQARTAYFFAGKDQDEGTVLHEGTHQLFSETRPVAKSLERMPNFWVVEGVACYMESLAEHPGYLTLGGLDAGRAPAVRVRLLRDHFYVPLNELVEMNMEGLQSDPRIAPLYSQSAGLVDFFMHYDSGCYREAFITYLSQVYAGKADDQTLARLTTGDYGQLDRQYREFMEAAGPPGENPGQSPERAASPAPDEPQSETIFPAATFPGKPRR